MCHVVTRLWPLIVMAALLGMLWQSPSSALTVCVSDFDNTTRFISYQPFADNVAFYLACSPGMDVVDRCYTRGELIPGAGVERLADQARSLGADVLVSGSISEKDKKVVASVTARRLWEASDPGLHVTVDDAANCRDAASRASALLKQEFERISAPLKAAARPASTSYAPRLAQLQKEQHELAERSLGAGDRHTESNPKEIHAHDLVDQREFSLMLARLAGCLKAGYDSLYDISDPDSPVALCDAACALAKGFGKPEPAGLTGNLDRKALAGLLGEHLGCPGKRSYGTVPEKPSGLVIDVRGLGLERSISPGIVSEDGAVLYPDKKHVPPVDEVEEHGIASFVRDLSDNHRAGSDPLIIRAIGVSGSARQIAVIAKEDAELVSESTRRSSYMSDWRVTFLVDKGY